MLTSLPWCIHHHLLTKRVTLRFHIRMCNAPMTMRRNGNLFKSYFTFFPITTVKKPFRIQNKAAKHQNTFRPTHQWLWGRVTREEQHRRKRLLLLLYVFFLPLSPLLQLLSSWWAFQSMSLQRQSVYVIWVQMLPGLHNLAGVEGWGKFGMCTSCYQISAREIPSYCTERT